tara:strand:+ start:336 stop:1316 length:981 start_codon:yes stop_codon:yes gene_type:complete
MKFIPDVLKRIIKKIFFKYFNKINKNLYKKNFITKIIFFIAVVQESLRLINHNYRLIFKNKINYNKLKQIYSLPRSGAHYSLNVLESYLEQLYNLGNGEGKIITNTFLPEEKSIVFGIDNYSKENLVPKIKYSNFNFIKFKRPNILNEINYDSFYTSHHPIQFNNLIDLNKIKAVVLIRDPIKATSSFVLLYFNHRLRNQEINIANLNNYRHIIYNRCELVIKFINYWNNLRKNKENFLFIKFEELIKNPHNSFLEILNFYKIEINENYLSKSIKFNSTENLHEIGFSDFKTITINDNLKLRDNIDSIIEEYFKKKNFDYKNYFKI